MVLLALAAFLVTFVLLASQLRTASGARSAHRAIVVRRIYQTQVVERVVSPGTGAAGGGSVTQSVTGSPAEALPPAPVLTRTS